jgi:hypothetical protein
MNFLSFILLVFSVFNFVIITHMYMIFHLNLEDFTEPFKPNELGFLFHCKINLVGRVECGGLWNTFNQLGIETHHKKYKGNYYYVDRIVQAKKLKVGWFHSCVIHENDKKASCWGLNFFGQIFPPTTTQDYTTLPYTFYDGPLIVDDIDVGLTYTCVNFKNLEEINPPLCKGLKL